MANDNLGRSRSDGNDEFYTQYGDIAKEMNAYLDFDANVFRDKTILLPCDDPEWSNFTKFFAQNFENFGIKKLISTSYAPASKNIDDLFEPTLFETESDIYDPKKSEMNGRIFTLTRDVNKDNRVDYKDLEWKYLEGDGDFRSEELKALRDEADLIITNPPFSLFRPFFAWLVEANKSFVILGNMNAITYKEVFPYLKDNKTWLGATRFGVGFMWFEVPANSPKKQGQKLEDGKLFQTIGNSAWFTNIDHGRRHQPLSLMTEADNIKFSKNSTIKDVGYQKYDNYDAIEVPNVVSIPSDYSGVMGVPITFLGKYNPDQFEIIGMSANGLVETKFKLEHHKSHNEPWVNGSPKYQIIFIRHRAPVK
jgi:hypothetical protein